MRINGLANGGLYLRIERYVPSFSLFLSLLSSVAFTGGQLHTSVLRKRGTQIKVFEVLWDFHLGRGGRRVCLCLSVCGCYVHLCWPLVGSLFTFAVLLPLLQRAGLLLKWPGERRRVLFFLHRVGDSVWKKGTCWTAAVLCTVFRVFSSRRTFSSSGFTV